MTLNVSTNKRRITRLNNVLNKPDSTLNSKNRRSINSSININTLQEHQQQIDEQIQNWLKAHTDFQASDLTALIQLIQLKSKTFVTVLIMPSVY
jgi:ABC-type phosphate transport system auxiliary subunit